MPRRAPRHIPRSCLSPTLASVQSRAGRRARRRNRADASQTGVEPCDFRGGRTSRPGAISLSETRRGRRLGIRDESLQLSRWCLQAAQTAPGLLRHDRPAYKRLMRIARYLTLSNFCEAARELRVVE